MPLAPSSAAPLTERYLSLLDRYAGFLTQEGKTVRRSSPEKARRIFEGSTETRQRALVSRLEVELEIFAETLAAGERLSDSRRLLWRHFSRSGFAPSSDLFDKIQQTDVVEVYGLDQIHLFQNLNFFDWIGFTLEEIYSDTWYALTRRDAAVESTLHEAGRRMFSGEQRSTFDPGVPWHLLEEVGSELLNKFYIRIKYISPVYEAGRLCCFVAVNECKPYAAGQAP